MAANEPVKSVQAAGTMTTLGIATNGKPVTTDTISNSNVKTNFFAATADEILKSLNYPVGQKVSPFANLALNQKATFTKAEELKAQEKEQATAQAAQVSSPNVKSVLTRFGKDLISNINKYDKTFNGGKLANEVIPSESDLYWAASSNGRFPAILYKMYQEMS